MDSKIADIIYCEKKRDCKWKGFALDGNGYGIGRIENFVQAWREWHEKECGGKLIQAVIVSENALYSQEPQKSEKQKVADLLGVPLSEVHTLDIQDGKLVEIVDVPQSVSTPAKPQPEKPDELLTDEEILQIAIDSLPESGGLVREVDIEWVKTICQAQLLKATPLIEAPLRERIKELEEQLNTAGLRQARLIRKSGAAPEGEK